MSEPRPGKTFLQIVDEKYGKTSTSATTSIAPYRPSGDGSRERKYAESALHTEASLVANAINGTRNDTLNTAAFNLSRFITAGHLTHDEVTQILTAAARQNGLDDVEIRQTLASGLKGGAAKHTGPAVPPPTIVSDVVEVTRSDISGGNTTTNATPARPLAAAFDAEQDFWTERESLNAIYTAALNRMCAPWAVLGHCAARALTQVRPHITLPPLIGGPGSLNWFAAIAAPSGGGKGSASAVARELVDQPVRERGTGSGEGITGAFYKPGTKTEPPEVHEAVMFMVDEVDTLTAMTNRTASTTMSILRSGFAGETLGFSYITRGRDIHIDAHSYRMTLVVSVQPARAGALMADHGGGTPQRFMWFPGIDPRISATPDVYAPTPLALPHASEWQYPRTLTVPDAARELILTERAKAARGEQAALDGHAMFCREKFAYALALLDGRTQMDADDWRLSGIAAEVSNATRDWVVAQLASVADQEAVERGRLLGVSSSVSDEEKAYRADQRTARLTRWVLDKVDDGPKTNRELHRSVAGRDRPWLDGAIQALTHAGVVGRDEDKKWVRL